MNLLNKSFNFQEQIGTEKEIEILANKKSTFFPTKLNEEIL